MLYVIAFSLRTRACMRGCCCVSNLYWLQTLNTLSCSLLSLSLSLCLSLSLSMSLYVSRCLCLSVSVSLSLSRCLCLAVSLSLSLSLCLYLCLSLSLSLALSLALSFFKLVLHPNNISQCSTLKKRKGIYVHRAPPSPCPIAIFFKLR